MRKKRGSQRKEKRSIIHNLMDESPFSRHMPTQWNFHAKEKPVYSITRNVNFHPKVNYHHLNHPLNESRPFLQKVLLSYTLAGRDYDIYTVGDLLSATYPLEEKGISSIRGDLAERISRRVMKRFLQTFDNGYGKLGGLFSKEFNPKHGFFI